jgi:xylulokinase
MANGTSRSEPIFLGIDVGTGGVRSLAVDPAGRVLAQATMEHPLYTPRPGWTEQDPADWWTGAVQGLRSILEALGPRRRDIAAIGLTGQMHGSVFLDESGVVVGPALLWNDQRTALECVAITERVGAERLLCIAGNPALTGFTAPKILWLRKHAPTQFARVARVLLPKDYLRFRLTGDYATDVSDASGTLLLDVARRRWSEEILAAVDLPMSLLPLLYEGTEITGTVSAEAAGVTGLPVGLPVVAGGGDQAAGAIGLGLIDEGSVSCSLGTSGVVFAVTNRPAVHHRGLLHVFCHAVPDRWHVMGVMLSAGGSLRWHRQAYGERLSYEELTAEARLVPPGADGLLFLPYLAGERTPHADPTARGAFVGLTLHHKRGHLTRAVLEGVAFGLADSLDLVRGIGVDAHEIRVSGGGARSSLWLHIIAAALGTPLRLMAVDEGPAFGAALLAAVGVGTFPSVTVGAASMVRAADRIPVTPEWSNLYQLARPVYADAYFRLAPLFAKLASRAALA